MIGYDPHSEEDFKKYFHYCSELDISSVWEEEARAMYNKLLELYERLKKKKGK